MKGLAHQKILVTGASRGIGRAIAEELLREKATVALHYRSGFKYVEEIVAQYGAKNTAPIAADLSDTSATIELFDKTVEVLGTVESVVINAGIFAASH